MTVDVVVLPRATVRRVLELVELVPASSALDVQVREELRRGLSVAAASRVGALLATSPRHAVSAVSATAAMVADDRPFGDELSTEQAAAQLGVSERTVRRRCHLPRSHPDALRSRGRGVLRVSAVDVDAASR